MTRERALADAFVELADTLVSEYDVTDLVYKLVDHCLRLVDAAQVGLLLSDQRGGLHVMASSSQQTQSLELLQLQADQGPCVECFHSGEPVTSMLSRDGHRWARFAAAALAAGYTDVHAVPLRLREQTIGAMNLFGTHDTSLSPDDLHLARALADIATIGILHQRAITDRETVIGQLEHALQSRIAIEQAKGALAERGGDGLDPDEAFQRLRSYARHHGLSLSALARDIVTGEVDGNAVLATLQLTPTEPRRG